MKGMFWIISMCIHDRQSEENFGKFKRKKVSPKIHFSYEQKLVLTCIQYTIGTMLS